jgi:hypothetical protein
MEKTIEPIFSSSSPIGVADNFNTTITTNIIPDVSNISSSSLIADNAVNVHMITLPVPANSPPPQLLDSISPCGTPPFGKPCRICVSSPLIVCIENDDFTTLSPCDCPPVHFTCALNFIHNPQNSNNPLCPNCNTPLDQQCLNKIGQHIDSHITPEPEPMNHVLPPMVFIPIPIIIPIAINTCDLGGVSDVLMTDAPLPHMDSIDSKLTYSASLSNTSIQLTPARDLCFVGHLSAIGSIIPEPVVIRFQDKKDIPFLVSGETDYVISDAEVSDFVISVNLVSMVGVLRLIGSLAQITKPQISALIKHCVRDFKSSTEMERTPHQLRIFFDQPSASFFFMLIPHFGKSPSPIAVGKLFNIIRDLCYKSSPTEIKLLKYLAIKIDPFTTKLPVSLKSTPLARLPKSIISQPNVLSFSLVVTCDKPAFFNLTSQSDLEWIIFNGLSKTYPDVVSISLVFCARTSSIPENMLNPITQRFFEVNYILKEGSPTVIVPVHIDDRIEFTLRPLDLPDAALGGVSISLLVCAKCIVPQNCNVNCPFCLTFHPFKDTDFGSSCPTRL